MAHREPQRLLRRADQGAVSHLVRRCTAAMVASIAAICGVFLIEPTAHHDDAAQYWVMAGRLARTGEPFYVAAVDHKGPAWVMMYRLAYAISADQRWFWFIMAIQVVAFATVIGLAVGWLLRSMRIGRRPATLTATILTAYLIFGPEGYSEVLYGRNITAALTAVAAALGYRAARGQSRNAPLAAGVAGLAMGVATQTVFTTLGTTVTLAVGIWLVADGGAERRRAVLMYLAGAAVGFASAPIWYVLQGAGSDFQTYFWDYNLAYGQTNTSLIDRGGRALRELGLHHLSRPFLLVAPVSLAVAARAHLDRRFAFIGLWWVGELVSISAPDRWYVHYWILLAAPAACLGALAFSQLTTGADPDAVGRSDHRIPRVAVAALAMIAGIYALPGVGIGAAAAAGFSGIDQSHTNRLAAQESEYTELRLAVARHSAPGDPVFIWARAAGAYVAVDRPAASRFDRRTWLTGEVYGTDTTVTIPGVWNDLIEDLVTTPPTLVIEFLDEPIDQRSPLGWYVGDGYQVVEELELARLHLRRTPSG